MELLIRGRTYSLRAGSACNTAVEYFYRILVILLYVLPVWGYNLDLQTATVLKGESGSMFGYSVALHHDQGSKWLLIGAPRAQTNQPGVIRGGAVYRCPTHNRTFCQAIPFDSKGNHIRHNGTHYRDIEDKSNQWFGATLQSSDNGIVVACAPRYVYFSTRFDKREPVGTCFVARSSSTDYEEYSPCRTRRWGYHRQGYCQAGFSISLSQQGRQLLVGAVGSWFWQGQLFNFNFEDGPGRYKATPEAMQKDDYSYMGYSSAVGNFDGDDNEDYVVGAPKGDQLLGKVIMYDQNLTVLDYIVGEQFGAYFGYSVAVEDLDGNGLDDIVIGAPFFSDFNADNSYETGRVYIYYQNQKRRFRRRTKDILDGKHTGSRFGLSIAGLGDIDYDGYNDLAVGAPYGGHDGRGAVYIYHGSIKGIITVVQQVIEAEQVLEGLTTFGWSLSGKLDMDDNKYPDLLVGAYDSNRALFLKSRPVVRVTPSVSIKPVNITLDEQDCVLDDGTAVPCIKVHTCMVYNGIGVPGELTFVLTLKLDSMLNDSSRVFDMVTRRREETTTVKIAKHKNYCTETSAYLVNNVRDKLTPIDVTFSFKLHERKRRRRRGVMPILNMRIPTFVKAQANISKDCGIDNNCVPNLDLIALETTDNHVLGSKDKIQFVIEVSNTGEAAYEASFFMTLPKGVSFYRTLNDESDIPVSCFLMDDNSQEVICDLGNPLPAGSVSKFDIQLTPDEVDGSMSELIFESLTNSSNAEAENNTLNNRATSRIPITQRADIQIGGSSKPEQIIYYKSDVEASKKSDYFGPSIEYQFRISNRPPGSGGIKKSIVVIEIPGPDRAGLSLLQLDKGGIETTKEDIQCQVYNSSVRKYEDSPGNVTVQLSEVEKEVLRQLEDSTAETRKKRETKKRSDPDSEAFACGKNRQSCMYIRCTVGPLKLDETVNITVKARVISSTLIKKKLATANMIVRGTARVVEMPFPDLKVDPSTLSVAAFEINTYINAERLFPKSDGIQAWIIGVAVSAGLLLLLLLIVLLWWCGFFKRNRPDEKAYLVPQNGEYKKVDGAPPDQRYQYM